MARPTAESQRHAALSALRAVLKADDGLALDSEGEAQVLAYMTELGLAPDNPMVVSFIDILRVKAQISTTITAAVEGAIIRGTAASAQTIEQMGERVESLTAAVAAIPPPVTIPPPIANTIIVEPTAMALFYSGICVAIAIIVALATWGIVTNLDDARFSASATRQLSAWLTTPGGRAANALLATNGNALDGELRHCQYFHEAGRTAMTCTFWADGAIPATTSDTVNRITTFATTAPAWPLVGLTAFVSVVILILRSIPKKEKKRAF